MKFQKKLSAAEKLVEVAGPLLADRPFASVSTREIAKTAHVNLSAISYHFGSKEGLYQAVFEKLIADLKPARDGFRTFLEAGTAAAKGNTGMQREVIRTFICAFIDALLSDENPQWRMRLIMREIHQTGPCFDLVMRQHIDVMHDLLGSLIAVVTQKPARDPSVILMSHSILGLCLQYALSESLISHRLNWDGYDVQKLDMIKNETVSMVFAMLGLSHPDPKEGKS